MCKNRLESVVFSINDDYSSQKVIREPEVRRAYARGVIDDSLFMAATRAGLTDSMTMKLASIFGWDIDFVMDIRKGDSFNLVYEEKFLDGERIGYGSILAATFTNRDTVLEAVYYTDSKGNSDYYTPAGKSMRKSFIRTPVDFTRISSPFNPNRLHPIFKTKRPHRAVDYAAPTGTPIKSAGDGVVKFAGRQNGYGNVVIIKHPNNIETLYAHQSRVARGFKKGTARKARTDNWLCGTNRLGNGATPSLRVPSEWQAPQSINYQAAGSAATAKIRDGQFPPDNPSYAG